MHTQSRAGTGDIVHTGGGSGLCDPSWSPALASNSHTEQALQWWLSAMHTPKEAREEVSAVMGFLLAAAAEVVGHMCAPKDGEAEAGASAVVVGHASSQ